MNDDIKVGKLYVVAGTKKRTPIVVSGVFEDMNIQYVEYYSIDTPEFLSTVFLNAFKRKYQEYKETTGE